MPNSYGAPTAGEETMNVYGVGPVPTMRAALLIPGDIIAVNTYVFVKVLTAQESGPKTRSITYHSLRRATPGDDGDYDADTRVAFPRKFLKSTLVGIIARAAVTGEN